ncbi:ABC transporter substrate-binding protein [Corallincola platygyrae]|uniref:ABC transporter substrate-binding protein n=1 Tax=Corallincola platygyrae TaxID=1193278 RepID=A0ABW4XL05_9GAMM
MKSWLLASSFIALLFVPTLSIAQAGQAPLKVGFGYHNAPPYAFISGGTLEKGIIHDIAVALGNDAALPVVFQETPRVRLSDHLHQGEVDMSCIANPAWFDSPDQFVWSGPLFSEQDRLYGRIEDKREVNEVGDLQLMRLGSIRGFHYPLLNALIDTHNVQLSNAAAHAENFDALSQERLDFVIADNITTSYLQHASGKTLFKTHPLKISEHEIHCVFSAKSNHEPKRLAMLLDELAKRGEIERILQRYIGGVPGGR